MPGKPEEPGPNPQSCDNACSQSREWDHQGCLGHFQEGHFQVLGAQEVHPGVYPQFQYCGPSSGESIDGLSVIGLHGLHCILAQ